MKYCSCYKVLSREDALNDLMNETLELLKAAQDGGSIEEIKDELSDIAFAVNRLQGALYNTRYYNIVKGDEAHIDKITARMARYGCIRSERNKVDHSVKPVVKTEETAKTWVVTKYAWAQAADKISEESPIGVWDDFDSIPAIYKAKMTYEFEDPCGYEFYSYHIHMVDKY